MSSGACESAETQEVLALAAIAAATGLDRGSFTAEFRCFEIEDGDRAGDRDPICFGRREERLGVVAAATGDARLASWDWPSPLPDSAVTSAAVRLMPPSAAAMRQARAPGKPRPLRGTRRRRAREAMRKPLSIRSTQVMRAGTRSIRLSLAHAPRNLMPATDKTCRKCCDRGRNRSINSSERTRNPSLPRAETPAAQSSIERAGWTVRVAAGLPTPANRPAA